MDLHCLECWFAKGYVVAADVGQIAEPKQESI